jgi:adenosylcobinamide kinase/adenosylcobinamide-phosphate guanylyltransferase
MPHIHLVTGGSRSGKSTFAQRLAEARPSPRVFIASCPVIDDEIRLRIQKHRHARSSAEWETVEETTRLVDVVERAHHARTLLIDCITLWVNNLMYADQKLGHKTTEEAIAVECQKLIAAGRRHPGLVILVTNEVGMGIVPDNPTSRLYRDLVGRANQILAAGADTVTLISCGLPMQLKGQ